MSEEQTSGSAGGEAAPAMTTTAIEKRVNDAVSAWYDIYFATAVRSGRPALSSDDLASLRKQVAAAVASA